MNEEQKFIKMLEAELTPKQMARLDNKIECIVLTRLEEASKIVDDILKNPSEDRKEELGKALEISPAYLLDYLRIYSKSSEDYPRESKEELDQLFEEFHNKYVKARDILWKLLPGTQGE